MKRKELNKIMKFLAERKFQSMDSNFEVVFIAQSLGKTEVAWAYVSVTLDWMDLIKKTKSQVYTG